MIVNGTNGNDTINVGGDASGVAVTGLAAQVAIQHQEPSDKLDVNGLGGNDAISAAALAAQAITLTLDGGAGDDTIAGGKGVETSARRRRERLDRRQRRQRRSRSSVPATTPSSGIRATAATPSRARTAPTRCCSTAPTAAEQVDLSANGNRLKFFRVQANITMDTAGVETVDFNALGGADTVTVNDLTGTDVKTVNANLAAALGGTTGDGATDQVIVNGSNGNDTINVGGDASGVAVTAGPEEQKGVPGLPLTVNITEHRSRERRAHDQRLRWKRHPRCDTAHRRLGRADVGRRRRGRPPLRRRRERHTARRRRERHSGRRSRPGRPRRRPGRQLPRAGLTAPTPPAANPGGPPRRPPYSSRAKEAARATWPLVLRAPRP